MISNGREPASCLGWVFYSKLGHIAIQCSKCMTWHAATSRVENSAQGLPCQLKIVHVLTHDVTGCTDCTCFEEVALPSHGGNFTLLQWDERYDKEKYSVNFLKSKIMPSVTNDFTY